MFLGRSVLFFQNRKFQRMQQQRTGFFRFDYRVDKSSRSGHIRIGEFLDVFPYLRLTHRVLVFCFHNFLAEDDVGSPFRSIRCLKMRRLIPYDCILQMHFPIADRYILSQSAGFCKHLFEYYSVFFIWIRLLDPAPMPTKKPAAIPDLFHSSAMTGPALFPA